MCWSRISNAFVSSEKVGEIVVLSVTFLVKIQDRFEGLESSSQRFFSIASSFDLLFWRKRWFISNGRHFDVNLIVVAGSFLNSTG